MSSQWTPVSEPPDRATREILVADASGEWNIGEYTKKGGFKMWDDQFHEYNAWEPIVYWMPVPDFPEFCEDRRL